MLHSALRNSVTSYFGDQLKINKDDISKTWKVLRFILGCDSNTNKQKNNFLIEDNLVTDSLDIANGFNNFFVPIGPKLAINLKSDIDPLSYVNYNINNIVVQEVSSNQIREVINSLNNSSPGHDELPSFVAKACIHEFIEPITHMVNESLKSGVFLSELKLARVVPIFKSGDPSLPINYSYISGSLNTNYNDVTDSKEAQQSVNTICSDVIACINHATREVNPIQDSKKNKFQKALPWWSRSTATAKNRKSFWYKIWLDCEKPRSGHTYECYKLAKAAYRRAHRLAFNKHVNSTFSTLN